MAGTQSATRRGLPRSLSEDEADRLADDVVPSWAGYFGAEGSPNSRRDMTRDPLPATRRDKTTADDAASSGAGKDSATEGPAAKKAGGEATKARAKKGAAKKDAGA